MPGAFHTEVAPKENGFQIILLNINFENTTTMDSSVKAIVVSQHKNIALPCKQQDVELSFCPATRDTPRWRS